MNSESLKVEGGKMKLCGSTAQLVVDSNRTAQKFTTSIVI